MFTQEKITKASKVCWQKSHWQVLHRQIRNGKITRAEFLKGQSCDENTNFELQPKISWYPIIEDS